MGHSQESFKFMDGSWGIEKDSYVTVDDYDDGYIKIWAGKGYYKRQKENDEDFNSWYKENYVNELKIPMSHVVELDLITEEQLVKKSMIGRGLTGFTLYGAIVGFSVLAPPLGVPIAIISALTGIGKKKRKHELFLISYLDESEPEELKMLILDTQTSFGNAFVKDKKIFANSLIKQYEQIPKADFVEAFKKKIEEAIKAQAVEEEPTEETLTDN